jgi:hypothetical protein
MRWSPLSVLRIFFDDDPWNDNWTFIAGEVVGADDERGAGPVRGD